MTKPEIVDATGGASRTALLIAAYRARASASKQPICHDPWAAALAGEEGGKLASHYDTLAPHMELWTAVRTAFIDARVDGALRPGRDGASKIRQVVLLGAGFDTRAARLARDGVRFFEVDRPETQEDKLRRLSLVADYPRDAATYVRCNFESDDFVERLTAAGFDAAAPALIVWEGVIPYLTEGAVRATLHRITTALDARTVVVFDHLRRKIVSGDVKDASDRDARDFVRFLGEPLRFGIDDVLPLLYEEGFRKVRSTSFDEACLDLTGTYERARKFRFQNMVVASRGAEELP